MAESFGAVSKACGNDLLWWEVSFSDDGGLFLIRDGYASVAALGTSAASTVRTAQHCAPCFEPRRSPRSGSVVHTRVLPTAVPFPRAGRAHGERHVPR